jgi:hypothetical protein
MRTLVVVFGILFASCAAEPVKSNKCESCAKTDDCESGLSCSQQVCVIPGCAATGNNTFSSCKDCK